jgi:hypothetical protein
MLRSKLLSLALIASLFLSSCASGVTPALLVAPDLTCRPLKEIIAEYPDCGPLIDAALNNRRESDILEALYCYDTTIQLLESSYNICNLPLGGSGAIPKK